MKQALIRVLGRVQGVFYRSHTQEKANELMLDGYAKNMSDGSVEILVQGEKENIEKLIKWCREGSPTAEVEEIKTEWKDPNPDIKGFSTY